VKLKIFDDWAHFGLRINYADFCKAGTIELNLTQLIHSFVIRKI